MKSKKSEKQICPKCGSTDIQTDFSNSVAVRIGHFINLKKCNNCKNIGTFFPIVKQKKEAIKKSKKPNLIYILFRPKKK